MSGKPRNCKATASTGKQGFAAHPENINRKGRKPRGETLAEVLRELGGETLQDTNITHERHWWQAVAHALDLLAEGIASGSFKASELSAFKVLMEMWHDRAYGKPTTPIDIPAAASFADYFAASAAERAAAKGER